MYYSAGNYEAFARPVKPEGVDKKSAYIIGTGLAGLSAAFYLVRDGQMKGEHIHLLEKLDLAGGSCDGRKDITKGFFMRARRAHPLNFSCSQGESARIQLRSIRGFCLKCAHLQPDEFLRHACLRQNFPERPSGA